MNDDHDIIDNTHIHSYNVHLLGRATLINPIGMGGNFRPTQVQQTVGYIQQQGDALTQQEAQRKLDLAEAEAQLQDLQNQFGVR